MASDSRAAGPVRALAGALFRFAVAYLAGITVAAALASIAGGSMPLLVLYSLAVGFPFFAAAATVGLIFWRSVFARPLRWAAAAPLVTGAIWFGFGLSMGDLLFGPAVGLYAMFCAACCAAVFYAAIRRWPPAP